MSAATRDTSNRKLASAKFSTSPSRWRWMSSSRQESHIELMSTSPSQQPQKNQVHAGTVAVHGRPCAAYFRRQNSSTNPPGQRFQSGVRFCGTVAPSRARRLRTIHITQLSYARIFLSCAFVVLALAASGCGDSQDRAVASAKTAQPTMAQFQVAAVRICKSRNRQGAALQRKRKQLATAFSSDSSASVREAYADNLTRLSKMDAEAQSAIADLARPSSAVLGRYIDGWRDRVGLTREAIGAIKSGDDLAASGIAERLEVSRARGVGQAEALGLSACTSS